jgi:hypothetical protein
MNKPEFNQEQIDWICYQIGDWYYEWKNKITREPVQHLLGYAKECLKTKLFPSRCEGCGASNVISGAKICFDCAIHKDER